MLKKLFKRKKRQQETKRQVPVIESLEPRILLSADLPGLDMPDADFDAVEDADVDRILAQAEEAFLAQQQAADDLAAQQQSDIEQVEEPDVALASHEPAEPLRQELVIVDPSVEDYETLLFDMQPLGGDKAELRIVILDPQRSGVDQISKILSERSDLDAIHLISHGGDGAIRIGSDTLDLALLQSEPDTFSEWGGALTAEGDILVYGCDVAETEQGQVLIDTLAEMTRADVAASDDLTGNTYLGGDWDLEYAKGEIEAELVVGADAQRSWHGVLADTTLESYDPGFAALSDTGYELKSGQSWGQTFSHDSGAGTYEVNKLEIVLSKAADATAGQDIVVSLRDSWNGAILGSASISSDSLTTGEAWYSLDIGATTLSDNTSYYIQVDSGGSGKVYLGVDNSGAYANGSLIDNDGNAVFGDDAAFRVIENNKVPVITSDGGGDAAAINVAENTTAVTTVSATDGDGEIPTYSISGGADAAKFLINSSTGELTFVSAPDFENPTDADLDNVYEVIVEADDGNGAIDTQTLSVTVINADEAGNDAPTNMLPAAQAINQDGMLLFSSATGTGISVSDPDAAGAVIQVTLTATNGTINLSGTKGLILTPPADGIDDATMVFTGTIADINAALEGATFVATLGFTGTANVQIITNDLGNTGPGGALSDTCLLYTADAADDN